MAVINVPGMMCEKCVARITGALTEANLKFTVTLENKTVTVDGDEAAVAAAIEAMDDIGFEAVKA